MNKVDKNDLQSSLNIVAVSSCPTGVAHTFMAAKSLEQEAAKRNIKIKVQKNASQGVIDQLTDEDIANADYVIIAADIKVDLAPFNGKKVFKTNTKTAIGKVAKLFDELDQKAEIQSGIVATSNSKKSKRFGENLFKGNMNIYKHILTGISFMLPFVIAGGVIIAISFFWGIYSADSKNHPDDYDKFAHSLKTIGDAAMALMIPALAGYIAYSIGDRPAIVPGFVGGWLAQNGFSGLTNILSDGENSNITSGFLGAVLAGVLAGYLIQGLKYLSKPIPQKFNSLKSMLIFPIFGTVITGLIILWGINTPIGFLQDKINEGLLSIGGTESSTNVGSTIGLGIALGALISVDFGGPFNKIAYLFGVADLALHTKAGTKSIIMAGVSAGCIVPPLATSVAVLFFPQRYTNSERNSGYTNILLGLTHITEGAIPFATKKPLVNIPCFMAGSIVATTMSLLLGSATAAPHGGVLVVMLVDKWYYWLLAIAVGSVISGLLLGLTTKIYDIADVKKPNILWYKIKETIKFIKANKGSEQSKEQLVAAKKDFRSKLKTDGQKIKEDYFAERKTALGNLLLSQRDENIEKINSSYDKAIVRLETKLANEKITSDQFNQIKEQRTVKRNTLQIKQEQNYEKKAQRYLR